MDTAFQQHLSTAFNDIIRRKANVFYKGCNRKEINFGNYISLMLGKIFGISKKKTEVSSGLPVGRYSDNNKTPEQMKNWDESESLYKEGKYLESIEQFFLYLRDPLANNVVFEKTGNGFEFQISQGSKIIRGSGNETHMQAKAMLARMEQVSVPVMRRLLEHNYILYYSRFSFQDNKIVMQFDSEIETANPNKLYYALKELCTTSDKQDDLLIRDFASLEAFDAGHIQEVPVEEKEARYAAMHQWIDEALEQVKKLDPEKYSGAVSYLVLALVYRIDYLVMPEGALMNELEKIQAIYFKKDNLTAFEKNHLMLEELNKFRLHSKEEFFKSIFRSIYTFSIRQPKSQQVIRDAISNANKNVDWYRDNNHPDIARQISEYGISYCQFAFSLPHPLTALFSLFMQVNYPDYFRLLGYSDQLYDTAEKRINKVAVENAVRAVIRQGKAKFKQLSFPYSEIKYDNLVNFNYSYTQALANLNFDV